MGDGSHGLDVFVAKGIHQMSNANQLAVHSCAAEGIEYGLAFDPQVGDEIAAHPVGLGRCAGEHGAESGDGASGIYG